MKKLYPSQKQERFIIRLPDGMRDRIAKAARANNRTMNGEVVSRLEQSFRTNPQLPTPHIEPSKLAESVPGNLQQEFSSLKKVVAELTEEIRRARAPSPPTTWRGKPV